MPKGIYIRTKPVWNKGLRGVQTAWNKGKKLSGEHRKNLSNAHIGQQGYWLGKKNIFISKEKNPMWKGDIAGYGSKHDWIKRSFGKADRCENITCLYPKVDLHNRIISKPKRFEWANISGQYKRDVKDWIKLCAFCHRQFDHGLLPTCP